MSVRDVRRRFADVVNDAVHGKVTHITSRGRSVAAIVPSSTARAQELAGGSEKLLEIVEQHLAQGAR